MWSPTCLFGRPPGHQHQQQHRNRAPKVHAVRALSRCVLAMAAAALWLGCAETQPTVAYSAAELLGFWNATMRNLADQHAGCPYERDLPFNHKSGACYPLKCKNSGEEVSLLRKSDGSIYKCDAGCDGWCSSLSR